ncbi:lipase family protein [Nocardia rhizosphaerihabitans]|uniref:Lipase n=1 Tax=Nocardia rhizosphaerihabitans TaxID=1691570 RepID=A0ABQ2K7R4_9NOCA|nr:lipase family protein [Nocardia rhizosphaerihabitans]GGN74413.1 lipase [Nocardia rhizosphaerihabitans]
MPKTMSRAAIAAVITAAALMTATYAPASAEPGSVLATELRPAGWHGMDRGSVIEYTTTDSSGAERPASGALFLPEGDAPATGWPVIAYDHGTLGSGPGCGGQADPELAPLPVNRAAEDELIARLVDQGYAVVAPDYLGLGRFDTGPHPYLEVYSEATATIDLVRAARAANPDLSRTWTAVGASQGGHAALSTAHVQQGYAPELDFRGIVAVDPASDVEKVLPLLGPAFPEIEGTAGLTGFTVSILAGLRATHPEAEVDSYLTPKGKAILDAAGGQCIDAIVANVKGLGFDDLFARSLSDGPLRTALSQYMTVPTSGYDVPILLLINATDAIVPSPLHAALVAQFAAGGVDFEAVTGFGQHTVLSRQMWDALDGFVARVNTAPPLR